MKKILFSYGNGAVLLVLGLACLTQSINPSFLASADAADVSQLSSSLLLSILGAIFFLAGFILVVLKVMKGHR